MSMRRNLAVGAAAQIVLSAQAASAATVDGMALHSSSAGAGPTIVFVHGWTCDGSSWTGQVPAFAKDYRVITLDLPGHGRSESPEYGKLRWTCSRAPSRPCAPRPAPEPSASCSSATAWARR